MSFTDSDAARAATSTARAAIARLDAAKPTEDLAADLLDAWEAVEVAIRMLVGGSSASGTELVREARQRELFTFDQANALAAFHGVSEHTGEAGYAPSATDVTVARRAMAALDEALRAPPPIAELDTPTVRIDARSAPPIAPRSRRGIWIALVLLVVAGAASGGAYYWFGGPRRDAVVRQAISEYEAGNRDVASADFRRAVLMDPGYAISHVYLARIAREAGNLPAANEELQLALTADPDNALALREMGAYLFTAGSFELARKFYVRAVSANPEDATAKGYLGCTLVKLGRIDEGERWITRAGPGVWTSCVTGGAAPNSAVH